MEEGIFIERSRGTALWSQNTFCSEAKVCRDFCGFPPPGRLSLYSELARVHAKLCQSSILRHTLLQQSTEQLYIFLFDSVVSLPCTHLSLTPFSFSCALSKLSVLTCRAVNQSFETKTRVRNFYAGVFRPSAVGEGEWESDEKHGKNACISYGVVVGVKWKESAFARVESKYYWGYWDDGSTDCN